MAWEWVGPVVGAGANIWGAERANRANQNEAATNRLFQQYNSDTAVRRSIEDFKAAGLNPALAYDRSASSPTGGGANIGNIMEGAASSALAYKTQREQMKLAREAQTVQTELAKAQGGKAHAEAKMADQMANETIQRIHMNLRLQPSVLRQAEANVENTLVNTLLNQYGLPAAANAAGFQQMMGKWAPGLQFGAGIAGNLTGVAGNIMKTIQALSRGNNTKGAQPTALPAGIKKAVAPPPIKFKK